MIFSMCIACVSGITVYLGIFTALSHTGGESEGEVFLFESITGGEAELFFRYQ